MCAQTLLDVSASAPLGPQLEGLEPIDIFWIEEHVAYCNKLFMDFVRMTCKDDPFRDDTIRIWREGCSCRYEREGCPCSC